MTGAIIDTAWQDRAACRGDLGFTDRPVRVQLAACQGCPVRFECRRYAVANDFVDVVAGGRFLGRKRFRGDGQAA